MHIVLQNQSGWTAATPAVLTRIADALETQLSAHVAPVWQTAGSSVQALEPGAPVPAGASLFALLDALPDDPQAEADHEVSPQGTAVGRVSAAECQAQGGSLFVGPQALSTLFSHEVLEAFLNPYANLFALQEDGTIWAQEIVDPVQGNAYDLGGVSVSAFVAPRFFRAGVGPYSYPEGIVTAPWTIAPEGYAIKGKSFSSLEPIFGDKVTLERKLKLIARSRVRTVLVRTKRIADALRGTL